MNVLLPILGIGLFFMSVRGMEKNYNLDGNAIIDDEFDECLPEKEFLELLLERRKYNDKSKEKHVLLKETIVEEEPDDERVDFIHNMRTYNKEYERKTDLVFDDVDQLIENTYKNGKRLKKRAYDKTKQFINLIDNTVDEVEDRINEKAKQINDLQLKTEDTLLQAQLDWENRINEETRRFNDFKVGVENKLLQEKLEWENKINEKARRFNDFKAETKNRLLQEKLEIQNEINEKTRQFNDFKVETKNRLLEEKLEIQNGINKTASEVKNLLTVQRDDLCDLYSDTSSNAMLNNALRISEYEAKESNELNDIVACSFLTMIFCAKSFNVSRRIYNNQNDN